MDKNYQFKVSQHTILQYNSVYLSLFTTNVIPNCLKIKGVINQITMSNVVMFLRTLTWVGGHGHWCLAPKDEGKTHSVLHVTYSVEFRCFWNH